MWFWAPFLSYSYWCEKSEEPKYLLMKLVFFIHILFKCDLYCFRFLKMWFDWTKCNLLNFNNLEINISWRNKVQLFQHFAEVEIDNWSSVTYGVPPYFSQLWGAYLYSFVNNSLTFEIWPFISNSCNLKWNIGNINWNKSKTKMQMVKYCVCHISAPERLIFSFLLYPI